MFPWDTNYMEFRGPLVQIQSFRPVISISQQWGDATKTGVATNCDWIFRKFFRRRSIHL